MKHIIVYFVFTIAFCCAHEKNIINELTKQNLPFQQTDPCLKVTCGHGKECIVDSLTEEPKCICVRECGLNTDPRRRVCSNFNNTWESDCHLHRHRCICSEVSSDNCEDNYSQLHINYYGDCKEIEECTDDILIDFPRRMREWLYNIMSKKYIPEQIKDKGRTHEWVNAVIWKYCDLDMQPHDRHVSRHELFPLRAPLLSMEPCIAKFLDSCDPNSDEKITLVEWGTCLGADEAELEDKCNQFIQN